MKNKLFFLFMAVVALFVGFGNHAEALAAAPLIIAPSVERGDYTRLITSLAETMGLTADQFKSKFKVQPFILKMAVYLQTGASSYVLSPRKGVDPNVIPTAQLLDQNDFFALTSLGLRIGRAAFASNTYSNWGNYPQLTYPEPNYHTGTGTTAGSEAASLQTLVNGNLTLSVAGDNVIENLGNQELFYTGDASYVGATPLRYPSFGGGDDATRGMRAITPGVIMDAMADNQFTVNIASGAKGNIDGAVSTGTTDSGVRNILYVVCAGWKIKNMAGGGVACPVRV